MIALALVLCNVVRSHIVLDAKGYPLTQCVGRYSSLFLGVLPDPMLSELTEGGVIGNWVVVLTGVSVKYHCQVTITHRCFV